MGRAPYRIGLAALRLPVSIGWEAAERAVPQTVRFDLDVALPTEPRAGLTDELADTVDYGQLAELIRAVANRGPYRLLERLAGAIRDEVRLVVPPGAEFTLRVTKEQPPIANLEGGASVTITG